MKQFVYASIVAAALSVAGLMAVPSAQAQGVCVDSVTAGGWVPDGVDLFANFGLNARSESRGEAPPRLTGQLDFVDADMDCHVVGFEVISYAVGGEVTNCPATGGLCRTIVYAVTVTEGGVPLVGDFEATVIVCDNGESANDTPDSFSITVYDVTDPLIPVLVEACSASGCLAGGDVQVHTFGNCP